MADAWTWDGTLDAGCAARHFTAPMPDPAALGPAIEGAVGITVDVHRP